MLHRDVINDQLFNQYIAAKNDLFSLRLDHWIKREFLSSQWLGIVFATVIFIFLWWRLLDKKRLIEILLFGLFIAIISSIIDGIGTELNAWDYPIKLGPMYFPLVVVDLLMLPYILMLLYQYFADWKNYLVAITIASAIFCFIIEPFLRYTGIYVLYTWKYHYSFPIYILIALFCKWLMHLILLRQERSM